MKKLILGIVVLAIIALVTLWPNKQLKKDIGFSKPTIKIGVSLPLTGDIAYMGKALQGSIDIVKEDLQKMSLKNNYEFIVENNAFDNKQIMAVNSKFINIDKVDAIIDFTTRVGLLTSAAAEKNSVIHFNACASDKGVAEGKYNFLHTTLPDKEAEIFAEKIASNYKNIALIVLNEVSAVISADEIIKELDKNGVGHYTVFINPNETNMRSIIEKTEKQNPDAYAIMLYSPTFEIFYKQLKEKGVNKPIISTHYMDNVTGLAFEDGTEYIAYADVKKDMKDRILKHNQGISDYQVCLGNPYDISMMLVRTFESSNNNQAALDYLTNLKEYRGVMGDVVQGEDGVFQALPVIKKIINGKPVIIEEN